LGPEGISARRQELVAEKEKALRSVVEGHDAAVREKFHLERFVTMVTGWDPEVSSFLASINRRARLYLVCFGQMDWKLTNIALEARQTGQLSCFSGGAYEAFQKQP
jgi:hypothetical protein